MIPIFMTVDYLDDNQRGLIEQLYNKYKGWVLKEAYGYVNNYHLAQDILNDTFLKLSRYVDTLQTLQDYQINGYIKRTVYSMAMNYISKESTERTKLEKWICENDPMIEVELESDKIIYRADVQNLLHKCMGQLNDRDRTLLIYKYALGMKYTEIAELYPIPRGNISSYVRRAKRKFKIIMRKETSDE